MEEEEGRTKGGRRNVEASLLLRGEKSPSGQEERKTARVQQEKILKKYAQSTNGFYPKQVVDGWQQIDFGMESRVYDDGKNVRKVGYNYLNFYDTPQAFLDGKISLNNHIFPDTPIELIGFTETNGANGKGSLFAPVYKQPFVKGEALKPSEQHLVDVEMEKYGFERRDKNDYVNKDYVIRDLHPENIIMDKDGNYMFIDTNPMLNTPDLGYGGEREYGEDQVLNLETN